MEKNKSDHRTLYTRRLIKDTFISLLETVPMNKITVSGICRAAEINRGTFYIHFLDIKDVFQDIELEFIDKIEKKVDAIILEGTRRHLLSNQMFDVLLRDPRLITLIKTDNAGNVVSTVMDYSKKIAVDALVNTGQMNYEDADLLLTFIIGGSMAVESRWIKDGVTDIAKSNDFLNQLVENCFPGLDIEAINSYVKASGWDHDSYTGA